jgi:hypothetical protein
LDEVKGFFLRLTKQGPYTVGDPEGGPGSQDHVHWGTDAKGRNGGAVNKDGTLRHGDKPPRIVRDLIVSKTGWDLSGLKAAQPFIMFDFQKQILNNLNQGLPLDTPGTSGDVLF